MITLIATLLKLFGIDERFKTLIAYGLLFAAIASGIWYIRHTGVVAERDRQALIAKAKEAQALRYIIEQNRRTEAIKTAAVEAANQSLAISAADAAAWRGIADDLTTELSALKTEEDKPDVQNPNIIIRTRNVCVVPDGYRERLLGIAPRARGVKPKPR